MCVQDSLLLCHVLAPPDIPLQLGVLLRDQLPHLLFQELDAPRLLHRLRRPAPDRPVPLRAKMDVRLPAEVRRPLQVSGPVRFVPQIGQAAPVDPLGPARPLKRPVRRLLPRLAGLLQPVPGLGRPRFLRPPLLRGLPVVALEPLLARKETLKQELKARKKELQEAQRRHRDNLQKQIRRAQARVSSAERKRRTRRLILMGSYLEHVTQEDPERKARLIKELDGFLKRDRDRGLFDLPPNKEISDGNSG